MELTAEQMLQYLLNLDQHGFDLKNLYFVYTEYDDETCYHYDQRIYGELYIDGIDIHLN